MPITPTEKIWMNGSWSPGRTPNPRAHALAALRHRCLRGHPRLRDGAGPGRLPAHRPHHPMHDSARILLMEMPYIGRRAGRRLEGTVRVTGAAVVLRPPDRVLRLRRDGPQHVAVLGRRGDRCWPWGAYLGDDAVTKGVRMKISSWIRHDHNTMPPAAEDHWQLVNSSLAKVEALKAGYDEALMFNPDGLVSGCTGEHLRRPSRRMFSPVPPTPNRRHDRRQPALAPRPPWRTTDSIPRRPRAAAQHNVRGHWRPRRDNRCGATR